MTRRAAILGLGRRGEAWAELCLAAGWDVCAFDPAPGAASAVARLPGLRRVETISNAARGADWILCAVPDRLDLIQMVVQRAQAEASENAVLAVASAGHDIEALQASAIRPGQVFRLVEPDAGGVALDVSERNPVELREVARLASAELAAVLSLRSPKSPGEDDQGAEAESA